MLTKHLATLVAITSLFSGTAISDDGHLHAARASQAVHHLAAAGGVLVHEISVLRNQEKSSRSAAPRFVPLQTWAGCGVWADPNKVVRSFSKSKVLRCGNANYGYFHIFNKHKADWEAKAAGTNQNWRDIADLAIEKALANPSVVKPRSANDTVCYSTKIFLVNTQNNKTVGSTIVRVVSGTRSNNIVTAFPSSSHCTGTE